MVLYFHKFTSIFSNGLFILYIDFFAETLNIRNRNRYKQ
ncbi:hypothetical protein B4113_1807 [Geobacillus sp. B4113_201601]|nr:hypothetical protein B4113_1807 [Geobacillus sp. B4113_201601]